MKKKFVLNLMSLLLLLFAFSSATAVWAWTSFNNSAKNEDMKMDIAGSDGVSIHEYHIYKWNGARGQGEEVSNNVVGDPLFDLPVSLTEYDTIFTDKNVDTPLIVKVIIREVPEENKTIRITTTCPEDHYKTSNNTLATYFSNICAIKFVVGTPEMNALTNPADIFARATAENNNNSTSFSFVSITDSTAQTVAGTPKSNTVIMEVENYSSYLQRLQLDDEEVDDCLVLYLQILYSPELVNVFDVQNVLDVTRIDISKIGIDLLDFPFDLSEMSFSYIN